MFESLQPFPPDPILGVITAHAADTNPDKVDLGVGVYKDEAGATPIPVAVKRAEQIRVDTETTKTYFSQVGNPLFNAEIQRFVFGDNNSLARDERVLTVQAPGGSGALKLGALLLGMARPHTGLWLSDPTWNNHNALFSHCDLTLHEYPYYDREHHNVRFDLMMDALRGARQGDAVLLHGCCHNPTGADMTASQWRELADLVAARGLFPYLDIAYHGLARGIDEDIEPVRIFAERVPEMLVAYSCSKNFGIYRDRVGALSVVGSSARETGIAFGQVLGIARRLYSVPPSHGQAVVGTILSTPELKDLWLNELAEMRDRINRVRKQFSAGMAAVAPQHDFAFIGRQYGMFSLLGITHAQIHQLREQFSVYMVDTSRINVAGINARNIDYLCQAIAAVL